MNYYAVLEATNALVGQQQWTLQRCRRRCDGPARYVIVDGNGAPVPLDNARKGRRLGYALGELLQCLSEQGDDELAEAAGRLLDQLNALEVSE